jgi:hypothetical protein
LESLDPPFWGRHRRGGGTTLIYTFKFGPNILFKKDYKTITATPGQMTIKETREIASETLDEDPGTVGQPPVTLPKKDEVFALVSLCRESKSNVWTSFGA